MKIKVNKTTTKEVEIEVKFPSYYVKNGGSNFAKILNETTCLSVWNSRNTPEYAQISYSKNVGGYIQDGEEITEEEFNKAYNHVLNQFNNDMKP
jgi:hypothetical protein